MKPRQAVWICACILSCLQIGNASAADQTKPGVGNGRAVSLATESPIVQSARQFLLRQAARIQDPAVRAATLDAVQNPNTCITSRAGLTEAGKSAILRQLVDQGLVDPASGSAFLDGIRAGVFPPVIDEASACPKLPQPFFSAPGSSFGGHHSYPGGLLVHETFNEISSLNFANAYRHVYGFSRPDGLPVIAPDETGPLSNHAADVFISQDVMIAAPIWHDWAKAIVFQWNADGSEFEEFNFGGNGLTDSFGAAPPRGDSSKTGAHHLLGAAEAMKRGLPADLIIAQLSAHAAPTNNLEYKVVNWIRTAAILAQVDPVARGFLYLDRHNHLRLAALRAAHPPVETNVLAEYVLHNLSDSDFNLTGPAITQMETVLEALAPQFGFDPRETSRYNNNFRNVVLSYFTAERLLMLYGNDGQRGVAAEIEKIRPRLTKKL